MKAIVVQVIGTITKQGGPSSSEYNDLLLLLFGILKVAKTNPLEIEKHVEHPEQSELFTKYPSILKNHHAVHFLCDTLKVQISAAMSPMI